MIRIFLSLFDPRGVFEPITAADVIIVGWLTLFLGFFFYATSRPLL